MSPEESSRLQAVLHRYPDVAFALTFGSRAVGRAREDSDIDIAIGTSRPLGTGEIGALVSELEQESGRQIDLILLDEAPAALAYRVFRDGVELMCRDRPSLVRRKARAILEWLDIAPLHERMARGVLEAAARGR